MLPAPGIYKKVLDTLACLISSPVALPLEVTSLPLGQPPLRIGLGPRILRVKVLGQPGLLLFPFLLLDGTIGQVCLGGAFPGSALAAACRCNFASSTKTTLEANE